jgi:hypothetical protein
MKNEELVAHTYMYQKLHVEELIRKHLPCLEALRDQVFSIALPVGVLALVYVTKSAFGKGMLETHIAALGVVGAGCFRIVTLYRVFE